MRLASVVVFALAAAASGLACGGPDSLWKTVEGATSTASSGGPATGGGGGGASAGGASAGGSSAGGASPGGSGSGGSAPAPLSDPNLDGPYGFAELDAVAAVAATGHDVPVHAAYPVSGPLGAPYPVVVVAHGFQLPASQYFSYVRRLASHGFVAMTADFPAGFMGANNVDNAKDVLGALDWAAAAPELAGKADVSLAGLTGHSLGGKVSLLAATMDARVKATITLDPVDASVACNPTDCPDVSALLPLALPTGFLGETTDATSLGPQACAPAPDNYMSFYGNAAAPSFAVTVLGANHMSFLDDVSTCGLACGFCNPATLPNATVNALAKAYVVAFYERWLRGNEAYEIFLTGPEASARYVETGLATIASK